MRARACWRTSCFGVAAVGAEREELHHLPRVVLVRRVLRVVASVQPQQHRRVLRHVEQQIVEGAEAVVPEELVLVQHQPLRADAVVRGREPVVPDQRHPLDERARGSHHPVEPPDVVVAPGVEGCERPALLVVRPVAHEMLAARMRQLVDGAFEPETSELLRFTGSRPEAGAPKQPLGLGGSERSAPDGDTGHARDHRQRSARTGSPIEGALKSHPTRDHRTPADHFSATTASTVVPESGRPAREQRAR